ncbi:MFS transporter [Saccharopolyspora gloriosae]|uniref:SHS family lactate transporter-like MFS transporter n=1 Tax=Saccharopolyspora gloriosae TaxID=455344 RepID=A0A840NEA4_9PSEU|nr:MFS transporter [Saccharopolyspora gloriosae]MBB5070260.1 SHS family lactate transporter-like MFS transporter [Saccharopolyspora gloriosae]
MGFSSGAAPEHPAAVTAATAYTSRERRLILLFAIVGALIESMELNLLSFPLTDLAASFAVSTQSVVGVITLQSLASIAGGFLFGWIADRWGRKASYVTFTAMYSIAAVVGGFAQDYTTFTLTRAIAGLAMGGAFGVIFAMFAESWKSRKRGFMGAVLQGMFIAGTLITQLVLYTTISALGSDAGWRTGFVAIGLGCLLIAGTAALWLPESKVWLAAKDEAGATAAAPVRAKPDWSVIRGAVFLTLTTTGVFAASYSYITFAPTYLRETAGVSLTASTIILTVGTLLGIASYVVAGTLSDRVGRRRATLYASVVGVAAFGAFAFADIGSPSVAVIALMGPAIGYAGFGVLGTWISEFYPTRYRAFGSNATYYVARGLGSGLFPLGAVALAGGDLHIALALGGVGALVGLVGCLFVQDTADRVISAGS